MSVPIRDVLVVHPNAGRRAALASALPSYRVVAVESKTEAAFRMADAAPALIIAPPDDARLFLRQLADTAPDALRVFICSKSDPAGLAELMQSAAEGHVFSVLDDALSGPELGRTISHLLQHRGSAFATVLPASYAVHFDCNEQGYVAWCLEIGNFGATLLLPADTSAAAFPPGAALEGLRIERDGHQLFKTTWAHVQRAQPVTDGYGTHLHLGVSWATAMHPPPPVPGVSMEEPSEVVATLRKALRREAVLWLQAVSDASV
ncbi:MAG TPA: PilZ domain-containing protein, partial [Archangium sp.]|nr:PilZ domain-containing protein [Archangium sp.]